MAFARHKPKLFAKFLGRAVIYYLLNLIYCRIYIGILHHINDDGLMNRARRNARLNTAWPTNALARSLNFTHILSAHRTSNVVKWLSAAQCFHAICTLFASFGLSNAKLIHFWRCWTLDAVQKVIAEGRMANVSGPYSQLHAVPSTCLPHVAHRHELRNKDQMENGWRNWQKMMLRRKYTKEYTANCKEHMCPRSHRCRIMLKYVFTFRSIYRLIWV